MLKRFSSVELNQKFQDCAEAIEDIDSKLDIIKSDMQKKFTILLEEQSFITQKATEILKGDYVPSRYMCICKNYPGQYESYGITIHPEFIENPTNLFNIITLDGNAYFNSNVTVLINNTMLDDYKDMLMHDTIKTKKQFFYKFDQNEIALDINVADSSLSSNNFNMIEIDPFIPGSFDIKRMDIYTYQTDGSKKTDPISFFNILDIGKQRIMLDKKYNFYRLTFIIDIKAESNIGDKKTYPFGLKHLYLYDADFKSDSYVDIEVDADDYIDEISNNFTMRTPFGDMARQIDESKARLYAENTGGIYSQETFPSYSEYNPNIIVNDTKSLYVHMPLNECVIGAKFGIKTR